MEFLEPIWNLLTGLDDFLICLMNYVIGGIRYMLQELFTVIFFVVFVVTLPFDFLIPDALDTALPQLDTQILGYINWIFPVGFLAQLYGYFITAFGLYRVLKWVAAKARGPIQPKLFN